jgi:dTDP-4-dehydrorhamnose reductase
VPIALTEVHLGGAADERLRWLFEAWKAAEEARAAGVDVRAMTVWSLLGAFDWDSLVTRRDQHYEAGVFDIIDGEPRPTVLADAIAALIRGDSFHHPALETPGWWRLPTRLRQRVEFEEFAAA